MSGSAFDDAMRAQAAAEAENHRLYQAQQAERERLGSENIAAFIRTMREHGIAAKPFRVTRTRWERVWWRRGMRAVTETIVEARGWAATLKYSTSDYGPAYVVEYYITEDGNVVHSGEGYMAPGYTSKSVLYRSAYIAQRARAIIASGDANDSQGCGPDTYLSD